ncbi:MAG: hypothetical protein JWO81_294 [Alphaproteobacteria bacterium]|nr:hypothetical protein [Alphaproteobacteria bacterium]
MMARPHLFLPLSAALAALAGCAAPGPYPSLAQRPIERALGEPGVPPVIAPLPDDPAVAARVAAFLGEAQAGDRTFLAALPAAQAAARRAGAVGSDSWLQAQQAVSRAQTAQAQTIRVLAELDRYAVDQANAKALSASDLQRLQAATAGVQRLADAEHAEIVRLQTALRTP